MMVENELCPFLKNCLSSFENAVTKYHLNLQIKETYVWNSRKIFKTKFPSLKAIY